MALNTAFIVTRITSDQTDPGASGPSARTLTAAIKDAGQTAIRARKSGKIYADTKGWAHDSTG